MAERQQRIEGSGGKDEAADMAGAESAALKRFKLLARRLLAVPRAELAEEQRKAAENKARRRQQSR